jgi:hypothetical protein
VFNCGGPFLVLNIGLMLNELTYCRFHKAPCLREKHSESVDHAFEILTCVKRPSLAQVQGYVVREKVTMLFQKRGGYKYSCPKTIYPEDIFQNHCLLNEAMA